MNNKERRAKTSQAKVCNFFAFITDKQRSDAMRCKGDKEKALAFETFFSPRRQMEFYYVCDVLDMCSPTFLSFFRMDVKAPNGIGQKQS